MPAHAAPTSEAAAAAAAATAGAAAETAVAEGLPGKLNDIFVYQRVSLVY